MILSCDFDGTCTTHEYPHVNYNKDIGSARVLRRFVKEGWLIIVNTMRSDKTLDDAVNWFKKNEIPLYGANENPTQKEWTNSPKVYAHLYIDDAGACVPLKTEPGYRPYIDWIKLEKWLENEGYLHAHSKI